MAHGMLHLISAIMCCTCFTHNCAKATRAYVLETVLGAVRRLSKISNCAFQCDSYH